MRMMMRVKATGGMGAHSRIRSTDGWRSDEGDEEEEVMMMTMMIH